MRRRALLSAVAAASLAGCLGRASTPGGRDDLSGTPSESPAWGPCPSFVDEADRTVCATARGDAAVYLVPSTRRFVEHADDDAVETVTFTLHNDGDADYALNPYDWAVARRTDDGWTHVAPTGPRAEPLSLLAPGDTYEWVLSTVQHPSGNADDRRDVVVDLSPGDRYAFRVHGTVGTGEDAPRVECVARFEYVRAVPEG